MQKLTPGDWFEERYRIIGVLGSGGFATVYEARDEQSGRTVAIKLLRPDDDRGGYDPVTRGRVQREIEALGQLRSPHTVQLFEHGATKDGLIYLVFEHIVGRDLSDVLDVQNRLDPSVVEHILRQLLHAIGEAHRAGVIHRDIKPQNVRVHERDGDPWSVKLLDFGIARSPEREARVTATGQLIGTPRFMSPEQLMGDDVDTRSDIYSLGVLAIQMLEGTEALLGPSWGDQMRRLRSGFVFAMPPNPPPQAARLYELVRRMTVREPAERLRDAETALAILNADQPDTVPRPAGESGDSASRDSSTGDSSTGDSGTTPRRLSNATLGVIAAAVTALATVAGLALWLVSGTEPEPKPSPPPAEPPTLDPAILKTAPAAPTPSEDTTDVDRTPNLPPGCSTEVQPGRDNYTWRDLNTTHKLEAYVPRGYDPETLHPAIAVFHDARLNVHEGIAAVGQELFALADRENVVLLFPEGQVNTVFNFRVRRKQAPWTDEAKSSAAAALLASDEVLCVDHQRIFLLGQGHGGAAVEALAGEPFAGAAVVGFLRREGRDAPRSPYLLLAPDDDQRAPLGGGKNPEKCGERRVVPLKQHVRGLEQTLRCKGEPATTSHPDGTCRRWMCELPLQVCQINGGRRWPGAPTNEHDAACPTGPDSKFPFGEVIWDFFSSIE